MEYLLSRRLGLYILGVVLCTTELGAGVVGHWKMLDVVRCVGDQVTQNGSALGGMDDEQRRMGREHD